MIAASRPVRVRPSASSGVMRVAGLGLALSVAAASLAGCSATDRASPSAASSSAMPPSAAPPSPTVTAGAGSAVVTFRAADGSTWRVRLEHAADIAIARDLLAGRPAPAIPTGRIVRGSPDVNVGWSWHLDAEDFAWADMAIEVCDGNPQGVEDRIVTSERYCPWGARVVAVDPVP